MIFVGCYVQPQIYRLIKLMTPFLMHGIWTNGWFKVHCIFGIEKYSDSTFYSAIVVHSILNRLICAKDDSKIEPKFKEFQFRKAHKWMHSSFTLNKGHSVGFFFIFKILDLGLSEKNINLWKWFVSSQIFLISVEKRKKNRPERTHIFLWFKEWLYKKLVA